MNIMSKSTSLININFSFNHTIYQFLFFVYYININLGLILIKKIQNISSNYVMRALATQLFYYSYKNTDSVINIIQFNHIDVIIVIFQKFNNKTIILIIKAIYDIFFIYSCFVSLSNY